MGSGAEADFAMPGKARRVAEDGKEVVLFDVASAVGEERDAGAVVFTPIGAWLPQVSINLATESLLTEETAEACRSKGAVGGGDNICDLDGETELEDGRAAVLEATVGVVVSCSAGIRVLN